MKITKSMIISPILFTLMTSFIFAQEKQKPNYPIPDARMFYSPLPDKHSIPCPDGGFVDVPYLYSISRSSDSEFIYLRDQKEFMIYYGLKEHVFVVGIMSKPIETNRTKAENELLKILKIDRHEACRLKLDLSVPAMLFPTYKDRSVNLGLSFCSKKPSTSKETPKGR